jgi:hypothetical protein
MAASLFRLLALEKYDAGGPVGCIRCEFGLKANDASHIATVRAGFHRSLPIMFAEIYYLVGASCAARPAAAYRLRRE